jgi:putative redox protein
MPQIQAVVEQTGPSASKGTVRTHSAVIDRPAAKGGTDQGPMGGEYLLLGLGGCFMSNLLAAARARNVDISSARVVVTGTIDGAPERFTAFTMNVSASCSEPDALSKLVTIAERGCISANTLKTAGPISIELQESPADQTVKA